MLTLMSPETHCSKCSRPFSLFARKGQTGGTGYGRIPSTEERICYTCCADRDRADMQHHGWTTLYLSVAEVTNWPGALRYRVTSQKTSPHNIGRTRTDVWFTDEHGAKWHGYQIGDNSQLCHCRRLKAKKGAR